MPPSSRREERHSDAHLNADGNLHALYAAFSEAIAETGDAAAAMDVILQGESVLKMMSAKAPTAITSEEMTKAVAQLKAAQVAAEPGLARAIGNLLGLVELIPHMTAANRPQTLAEEQFAKSITGRTIVELLLGLVYKPEIPIEVAAGALGLIAGPVAIALCDLPGLADEHRLQLGEIAAEGTRDALRMMVSFLEENGAEVPEHILPKAERFDAKELTARQNQRRGDAVVEELFTS